MLCVQAAPPAVLAGSLFADNWRAAWSNTHSSVTTVLGTLEILKDSELGKMEIFEIFNI